MQAVSDAYIESMSEPFRNRGYIKGSIGIINSEAQNNAVADDKNNNLRIFQMQKTIYVLFGKPVIRYHRTGFFKIGRIHVFFAKRRFGTYIL